MSDLIPAESLQQRIYIIRGHKVMLSPDLAQLYQVEPRVLVQAVRRNSESFPGDFMFQLNLAETRVLRSQFVILERGRYAKYAPLAFTEHGVAMLSSVLRSKRARRVNIAIMRTFVSLRETLALHKELAKRLDLVEHKTKEHGIKLAGVFDDIRRLMEVPEKSKPSIGFKNS